MENVNKAGRPTKKQGLFKEKRDKELLEMWEKNYPLDYIAGYFNITKARVIQIKNKLISPQSVTGKK